MSFYDCDPRFISSNDYAFFSENLYLKSAYSSMGRLLLGFLQIMHI